jgi:L-malate glycosyltransferase
MKILILANPANSHTIKWINSLSEKGIEIYLFGLNKFDKNLYNKNVNIEIFNISRFIRDSQDGSFSKVIYLASLIKIKNLIKKIKPDILHAHYVSSYGLLGTLTGFHPYIISVWGTDIYYVPERNMIHKKLIEFSLCKADKILSTSHVMAMQTKKYIDKEIDIIPFGVDTNKFRPMQIESLFNREDIVVGTIKGLEKKYGVEYLIKAFKLVSDKYMSVRLKLLIVGGGSEEKYLKKLAKELNLENRIVFTGFITPDEIPKYHNMLDIYVALSISESFGVSVLEASACEKPVIVSNAEGFVEVVKDNETGFIVEKRNIQQAADALDKLINNKKLRERIGKAARQNVLRLFNWNENVTQMINVYKQYVSIV